jgi:hypothetical protein
VRSRWDSSAASRSWPIRRRNTALICCRKSPEMPGLDRLAVLMLADGRHCAHVYYTGRATVLVVKRSEALPTGSTGSGIALSIPPVDLWATP